jgi:hypothetical protein
VFRLGGALLDPIAQSHHTESLAENSTSRCAAI